MGRRHTVAGLNMTIKQQHIDAVVGMTVIDTAGGTGKLHSGENLRDTALTGFAFGNKELS